MSAVSPEGVDARLYGGVDGNDITLTEKRTWSNNKVIEFKLRNDSLHKIQLNLLFFCLTLFLGNLTDSLTVVTLSAVALAFHCKRITTSIDFDTLLVVESVGIQISSEKIFSGFNSGQFLPWATIEDVFVNEVITGGTILPHIPRQRICQRRRTDSAGSIIQRIETIQGMPGIHVWGVGKSDRAGTLQTQQPTLNVPGSYWLSHKQNIYKFTFQYHEPIRDAQEFLYKDELMRVIRRIIKCQPSQGQLSTVHLSITYKHTFWTRQDKMFAMLKFRNRQGAAVFPQAFILTIAFIDVPQRKINGLVIKGDPNLDYKDSGSIQALPISPNCASKNALNVIVPQHTEDNKNFIKSFTQPHELSSVADTLESTATRWTRNRRSKRRDSWTNSSESIPMDRYNNHLGLGDTSAAAIFGDGDKDFAQPGFLNARPYSECYKPSIGQATVGAEKTTQNRDSGEPAIESEPTTPRSSNITDQVMEGLMFTIKQVEDNVRVVEQRTKMELDEVLENSEKAETKEGEKCLVNSSLLRLENLVTKIEVPIKQFKDPKMSDTASVIDSLALLSHYPAPDLTGTSTIRCSTSKPVVMEQGNTPFRRTNLSPFGKSLKSNSSLPTDGSVPIQLAGMSLDGRGVNVTKETLTGEKGSEFVSHEISAGGRKKSFPIENEKTKENFNGTTSSVRNVYHDNNNNDDDDNINNNNNNNMANGQVQIDMLKLLQDITRGAKVVVERISDADIRNATGSSTIPVSTAKSIVARSRRLTRSRK